ncbi:MAG TPA: chemotaxis protein CheX [Kofleriaceae bacterium]|jgi:CheY-specific phosphatase CheX|nr:chemotaxis protein CheX [Kofleriaceae bacterium]
MSTSPKVSPAEWRTAVEGAAHELATNALSFPGATVRAAVGAERAISMIGAHIPLVGGGKAFDLSLVSSPEGCRGLARAILMADGAALRDAEVADAVGELVNMLAGSVKRRLSGQCADLVLGLPLFIHGYIEPSDRLQVIALPTQFGAIEAMVVIAGQRS